MFSSFKPVVYVRLSPQRLSVRNAKTGEEISEQELVARDFPSDGQVLS